MMLCKINWHINSSKDLLVLDLFQLYYNSSSKYKIKENGLSLSLVFTSSADVSFVS